MDETNWCPPQMLVWKDTECARPSGPSTLCRVLEGFKSENDSGGQLSARESALEQARLSPDGSVDQRDAYEAGFDIDHGFREVPHELLKEDNWSVKLMGKWKHRENIYELESLALLKAFSRIARGRFGHDTRQLLLVDNMAVCLAFSRCRSKNRRVLNIIRKFSAWSLARNVDCAIRWVPSELNAADKPSRAQGIKADPNTFPTSYIKADESKQSEKLGVQLRQPHNISFADSESSGVGSLVGHAESGRKTPWRPNTPGQSQRAEANSRSPKTEQHLLKHHGSRESCCYKGSGARTDVGNPTKAETQEVPGQSVCGRSQRDHVPSEKASLKVLPEGGGPAFGVRKASGPSLNKCFWSGEQAHKGEKLLAAFMHQRPRFGRLGIPEVAPRLAGFERPEAPHPSPKQKVVASQRLDILCVRATKAEPHGLRHGGSELLRQTSRVAEKYHVLAGAPGAAGYCGVDSSSVPGTLSGLEKPASTTCL